MVGYQPLTITNIGAGGMAWGTTPQGINCYIPKRLGAGLEVFKTYMAHTMPNQWHPEKTPLIAVSIDLDTGIAMSPNAQDAPADPALDAPAAPSFEPVDAPQKSDLRFIAQRARDLVASGGVWTTNGLARALCGKDTSPEMFLAAVRYISTYLIQAHARGEIARLEVRSAADAPKASIVRWGKNWGVFA